MLETEYAMTYHLEVEGPALADDGATGARRQYWLMKHATLIGPRINAVSAMPGIDWFTPGKGRFGYPHVRLAFRTEDGVLVLLDYRGVVEASDAFAAAVEADRATDWGDQYMRIAMFFAADDQRYDWLNQNLFLARGRLRGATSIQYEVHRLL